MCIAQLARLVEHAKSDQARISAASVLLDRGWGRPTTVVVGDDELPAIGIHSSTAAALSPEERAQLVAAIAAGLKASS